MAPQILLKIKVKIANNSLFHIKTMLIHIGILGQDTQMWIAEHSESFTSQRNPSIVAWIHTHVNGNECFFSSIDVHTQFAYEKIFPDVLGCVVELHKYKVANVEFYQLTEQGDSKVAKCREKGHHESCSNPAYYQSSKLEVDLSGPVPNTLNVFDARTGVLLQFKMEVNESIFKVKCLYCSKYFKPASIMVHISKSFKCSSALDDQAK